MIYKRKQQVAPKWLRRASWLALISLAWMQLAFAGHQFEHSGAVAETCEICIQVDRLDDTVVETPAILEVPRLAGLSTCLRSDALITRVVVVAFNPRAPPVI